MIEKTLLKFYISDNKQLVGFVSRHAKTNKLMGVREDSSYRKRICVLSEELKKNGSVVPDALYEVELKLMHQGKGYVVTSAIRKYFEAQIELVIKPHKLYQVIARFGNKEIYFDPLNGHSDSSRTLPGVLKELNKRTDVACPDNVISDFIDKAQELLRQMKEDGYNIG